MTKERARDATVSLVIFESYLIRFLMALILW